MMNNRPGFRRFVSVEDDSKPSLINLDDFEEQFFAHFGSIELSFSSESPCEGVGDLYITTGRIIWIADSSSSNKTLKAFDFDVPYIILHALTHDVNTYPKPCLYCQLDAPEQEDPEDDDQDFGECFFVPSESDEACLQKLFDAFSEAAQRNPDDHEEEEGDFYTGDDELIYNKDEVRLGAEQVERLNHLESVFHVDDSRTHQCEEEEAPGQFDNANAENDAFPAMDEA